ncbi:DUF1403 family protein [Mesorhizobium sp. 1B3]|uniref:DUF1403 family protein n=1 Tax=Mesorhizobium sp. 1B3 TaxID=3243599 RepID=UPI003D973795
MILRPNPSRQRVVEPARPEPSTPTTPVPSWLRQAAQQPLTLEDAAIAAGAALGALDHVIRRQARWAGVWRQRLALAAAAVTARQAGRIEDEATLRDAVLLTRPGDDVGPAGSFVLAWRRLVGRPAETLLTAPSIAAVLDEFGLPHDDGVASELADDLRQLSAGEGLVGMLAGVFAVAERHSFGRVVGLWLADALLAQRLGWTYAVPLLGTAGALGVRPNRARRSANDIAATRGEDEADRTKNLLAMQAGAALRAIDLSAELKRRADRLLAVAPKLRAKGADTVVGHLLDDDALMASRGDKTAGMSDRGLRRLFDRLVELGAVRELSGRPTFRIYGL